MARARNIKPGFFSNDQLAELPPLTRLLFAGLWTIADRAGRLEDRPNKIKAEILPYDKADADKMLAALAAKGFVLRYKIGGVKYIQVLAFSKHQNPHKNEAPSTIPAPDEHSTSIVQEPTKAGTTRADSLIPDSLSTDSLNSDSGFPLVATEPAASDRGPKTAPVWKAYSDAYQRRYGVEPTRNATVNGQLAQFVGRVPLSDAPGIAAFYVSHQKAFYVSNKHPVGLMLKDAEGLRTEWLSGRTVTETEARMADKTQATGNVFHKLIAETERGH